MNAGKDKCTFVYFVFSSFEKGSPVQFKTGQCLRRPGKVVKRGELDETVYQSIGSPNGIKSKTNLKYVNQT
jgi:hypothetical protein